MKIDTPQKNVLKALQSFGFEIIRYNEHIKMKNEAGVSISVPNHKKLKGSTLLQICRDGSIDKKAFFAKV